MPGRSRRQHACLAPPGAASELLSPSPILDLPSSVLRHILAQHPLKFRLGTCSLVCSAWAAAAAEATTAITLNCWWDQRHSDALTAWLRKHASAALQLLVVKVQWDHHSFSPPWQQLHGLRVLTLARFVLPSGSMRQLSGLTALTELSLSDVVCSSSCSQVVTRTQAQKQQEQPRWQQQALSAARDTASVAATASELASTLPRLLALVSLSLGGDIAAALLPALRIAASAAESVNFLQQQLASLKLARATCITLKLFAVLPATLTRLELQAVGPGLTQYSEGGWDITRSVKVGQATTPRLGQLTQLQQLDLRGIGVDGSQPGRLTELFAGLTQLTAFSLNGHSSVMEWVYISSRSSPELAEFLSAMGCLTSLRSLVMTGGFRCEHWDSDDEEPWWEELGEEPAPLTAGLVASTSLTRLYRPHQPATGLWAPLVWPPRSVPASPG